MLRQADSVANSDSVEKFLTAFRLNLNSNGIVLPFGRAAFALTKLLKAVLDEKRSYVLISAFNCPVVNDAILAAGAKPRCFDFADPNGRIDWDAIAAKIPANVGAIIVPHLFGVPTDFRPIIDTARKRSILIIEDCAHCVGGEIGTQAAGTLGDASIFSFSYDKPISLGGGGALLLNSAVLERFPKIINQLEVPQKTTNELLELQEFRKYLKQRRAHLCGFGTIDGRLQKFIMRFFRTEFRSYQSPMGLGALRAELGLQQMELLKGVQFERNQNQRKLSECGVSGWYVDDNVTPMWLKQRVLVASASLGQSISARMQKQRIRIGNFNWPSLIDSAEDFDDMPNAKLAATCGIDVPVHQNLNAGSIAQIVKAFVNDA